MQRGFSVLCLLITLTGCTENYTHDANLAARRAVEFAEIAFVKHDHEKGYLLLADKARAYVPLEKFKEKVAAIHPNGFPRKVVATGAVPIQGEQIVQVTLRGEGGGRQFDYALTVVGTAQADYRVTTFNGRAIPLLPSG